jgi:iron complex transport system ATP-binding protein
MLELKQVSVSAFSQTLIRNINLSVKAGEFVAIIGPNGAGKSTLLKAMAGSGNIRGGAKINGHPHASLSASQLAMHRSVLSQSDNLTAALPVGEVIKLGLLPVASKLSQIEQLRWVDEVADQLSLDHFLHRNYQTLSGGERARVRFARLSLQLRCRDALSPSYRKATRYALLDEPLAALDLKYQRQMIDCMHSLVNEYTAVVAVIHDLNWLSGHIGRVLVVVNGALVADGPPDDVLTNPNLSLWYDTPLSIQHSANLDGASSQPRIAIHA